MRMARTITQKRPAMPPTDGKRVSLSDLIENQRQARRWFFNHLLNVPESDWDFSPGPACASLRQILRQIIRSQREYLQRLRTGEALIVPPEEAADIGGLCAQAVAAHEAVLTYLQEQGAREPLDLPVELPFVGRSTLGRQIAAGTRTWDYYAGQVTYLRLLRDPEWDYLGSVYGSTAAGGLTVTNLSRSEAPRELPEELEEDEEIDAPEGLRESEGLDHRRPGRRD